MSPFRLVFAGSPTAAVPSLEALIQSEHDVAAVLTRADSPQGRRGILTPTPVADAAANIPVIKSNRLAGEVSDQITTLAPDLGVIVAYGGLVREPLLSTPRFGWINLHFSLLPRWRGAAPVQHAIIAGDDQTGATVFQLVPELDAGDLLGSITTQIGHHQTAGSLLDSLAISGAELLLRVVDELANGTAQPVAQVGPVSLAPKLSITDGVLDFNRTAREVHNRFRGVTPEPGAFTTLDGVRLKVIDAMIAWDAPRLPPGTLTLEGKRVLIGTATEPIELVTVHPAGRKQMSAADWWRGRPAGSAIQVDAAQ
jgi:methionyl-tRNA formyltransferase